MDDFAQFQQGYQAEARNREAPAMDSDVEEIMGDPDNPNEIVTFAPTEAFKLGYFDVACLVVNRMIGTCL